MLLIIVICFVVGGLTKQVSYFLYATELHNQTVDLPNLMDYGWLTQAAATCAINPLIYGILDRKLSFIKICQNKNRLTGYGIFTKSQNLIIHA